MNGLDAPGFSCFVASPQGDLSMTGDSLAVALEGCGHDTTYGEYFKAIAKVLTQDEQALSWMLAKYAKRVELPDKVVIRAEKHGALYHPASLEMEWKNGNTGGFIARFAVLTAFSPRGREALCQEALVLEGLRQTPGRGFLPRVLAMRESETATFLVVPWFSGFHEFHVVHGGDFTLWDHDRGVRRLGREQIREVFFQAGRILSLCLDPFTGACIHPWSHAAGDFILRLAGEEVEVRLTTARQYGPLIETDYPLSALLAFVLDLALRMRLDRVEGVGKWLWLEQELLHRALEGLYAAAAQHPANAMSLHTLAELLPTFSSEELLQAHEPLLGLFSRSELEIILPRLDAHCRELGAALQLASSSSGVPK